MTRIERTYALFGGLVVTILLAGLFAEIDLNRIAGGLALIALLIAGAMIVENRDVA